MAHSEQTIAAIPEWNKRKLAQWARIADKVPGLQLVRHGVGQSNFMLRHAPEDPADVHEGVVIGQLPQDEFKLVKGKREAVPEKKKQPERRAIDLNDDQIDQVLACWAEGESALALPFVDRVWDGEGRERTR